MTQQERKLAEKALKKGFKSERDTSLAIQLLEDLINERSLQQARQILAKTSKKCFEHFPIAHMAAVVCHLLENYGKAAEYLRICIRLEPSDPNLYNEIGQCLNKTGNFNEAIASYQQALQLNSNFPDALSNLAKVYAVTGHRDKAEACYSQALVLEPGSPRILYNFGTFKIDDNDFLESRQLINLALENGYNHPDAVSNLAIAEMELGYWDRAEQILLNLFETIQDHQQSLAIYAVLAQRRGNFELGNEYLDRCLAHNPQHEDALLLKAQALLKDGLYNDVLECIGRHAFTGHKYAKIRAIEYSARQKACIWGEEMDALSVEIDGYLDSFRGYPIEPPLQTTSRNASPRTTLLSAKTWSDNLSHGVHSTDSGFTQTSKDINRKVRIGYISYDFRNHAIAHLIHRIFALHDRDKFKVYCFSASSDDGSHYRKEIMNGCDAFIEINGKGAPAAAEIIRSKGIDILIDLNGHTEGNRLDIFAHKPAPVSVTWLGFPGTTGANFIDYIIVDPIVCPPGYEKYLTEVPVYMPHTYQCADTFTSIAPVSRIEAGIPEGKVVIACMNQSYKLDQKTFRCWLQVMADMPDTLLWLLSMGEQVENQLHQFASLMDIEPERIIFAPKLPKADHLARLSVADFAVDTVIYNGHTTTRDCIECGLPVITLLGTHFPSNVSASLLNAYGLGDLVQPNFDHYAAKIREFASDKNALSEAKMRVHAASKATQVSTEGFLKDFENALSKMWQTYCAGKKPHKIR